MSMAEAASSVENVVQRQLDAYNAKDIEAFMSVWDTNAQYFLHSDQLVAKGAAEIRARHVARFQEANLHGRLLARMSVGNLVVDREVVTRTFPEGPGEVDVIAIYEIAHRKITKAWFKQGIPRIFDKV